MTTLPESSMPDDGKLPPPAPGSTPPQTPQSAPPLTDEQINDIVVRRLRELGYL